MRIIESIKNGLFRLFYRDSRWLLYCVKITVKMGVSFDKAPSRPFIKHRTLTQGLGITV